MPSAPSGTPSATPRSAHVRWTSGSIRAILPAALHAPTTPAPSLSTPPSAVVLHAAHGAPAPRRARRRRRRDGVPHGRRGRLLRAHEPPGPGEPGRGGAQGTGRALTVARR